MDPNGGVDLTESVKEIVHPKELLKKVIIFLSFAHKKYSRIMVELLIMSNGLF